MYLSSLDVLYLAAISILYRARILYLYVQNVFTGILELNTFRRKGELYLQTLFQWAAQDP